ncbi:MAG: 50S ribosomal protein L18 [Candidatus Auribacterota bacterium]|nr:50S ribosomal protein L18 [Candidatus Auribacterota bacterium]
MKSRNRKNLNRKKRARRVRKKLRGTAVRPRMSVYRSLKNISVQFIDDENSRTLAALSTLSSVFREKYEKGGGTVEAAGVLGELAGEMASGLKIKEVNFDRGGYQYHGRVKALAEGCRKTGLIL